MKSNIAKSISFLKKNKIALMLTAIILIGAYLRLSDFSNLARFNADQVRDAKVVDAMFEGQFPLLGPKAGGTTFKLGPAFYYLEFASGLVFGNSPEGIAVIVPILSVASIFILFLLLRFYFSANISLLLVFLYSTSYYAIRYTRFAWNPNAIPFFLFTFFWAILRILETEKNKRLKWNISLGVIMGISMQLHTTLLVLMPAIFLGAQLHTFLKEKEIRVRNFLLTIFIIILLHIPFFAYDIQNDGENMKSFFTGALTKTEKNSSTINNALLDGQFFIQGSAYVLSGQEPEKNWLRPFKLMSSRNIPEIILFISGIAFFLSGTLLLITKVKQLKDSKRGKLLGLTALMTIFSFILFFPIANELNLRFFMVIIFLPFIFFGLIAEFVLEKIKNKKSVWAVLILLALLLSALNIYSYHKTYDLDNYQAKESVYGGISLGEARKIQGFITKGIAGNPSAKGYYLEKFEFERSIKYFNEKDGLEIKEFKNEIFSDEILFVIIKKTELETYHYPSSRFDLIDKDTFSRFTVLALKARDIGTEDSCRIGFITDIHASYSKSSENFIRKESSLPLEAFAEKMNKQFKPDFVVQGGDMIDGREKSKDTARLVLDSTIRYFSKIDSPTLHVMGNHETRSGGVTLKQWLDMTGNTSTYYARDCKDTKIIILDGTDTTKDDYYALSEKQMDWLGQILESSRGMKKIVFLHEPLITRAEMSSDLKFEKEFDPIQSAKIKKLFENNGVSMIISGHNEFLYRKNENNLIHQALPGIFKSKDEKISWYHSFYEITTTEGSPVKMYYKKNTNEKTYQTLAIPSEDFDKIIK
ncbi:MAG: hypothetical protein ACD_56C00136G0001 [uncultured bacterium]|nr:MAG: hypothetical protein ACD_56C00136G0001 [uncultured bacterium]